MDDPLRKLEPRIQHIGRQLLDAARSYQASKLSAAFWSDKLMNWALADPAFKVQLFRLVDTFPSLQTPDAIHRHLNEYLLRPGVKTPAGLKAGLKAGGFLKGTMARTVAGQIEGMAKTFIAGQDAAQALPTLRQRWDQGIAFSVDVLGEACLSEAEADTYRKRYLDLIRTLPEHVAGWPPQPRLTSDHLAAIPICNVSIKITAVAAKVEPIDYESSAQRVMAGIGPVLEAAAARNVFVNFDMEHRQLKDLTLAVFRRCAERYDGPMGIAMQAYLRSGDEDAQRVIEWARALGRRVTVRLVKGAYWDYEMIAAQHRGWPTPVWASKAQTDACFERMTAAFVEATPADPDAGGVTLALGSHNLRSIAAALALLEQRGLPPEAIEIQMLYGMAEPLKRMAVDQGLRVREYTPVGQMIPGMAYLVRRLLENTSNESWLRHGFLDQMSPDELLASPHDNGDEPDLDLQPDGFRNEPMRDFADTPQREAFGAAVERAVAPIVANDGTVEAASDAVARAAAAFGAWRQTTPEHRASVLTGVAARMREQRDDLAAVMVKEAGKPWAEADADVCEAIDFCRYYAQQAVEMFAPHRVGDLLGEEDMLLHEPRGVAVAISPWNFPLAICCGMTTAALVTGNPVIVKPAEQTPGIAKRMCELLWEAGAPRDALQFLPGRGETVGAALVRDPRVSLIAFTGSKAVGLEIVQAASAASDGQPHIKKVIAEMGGKNAIIVDSSADLDEAVAGVRQSAFGYAGQKCSACSRVIVDNATHDVFLDRLVESSRALVVGQAASPETDVPPVIDDNAAAKIRSHIDIGRSEGREALAVPGEGRLIGPHIFADITTDHRLANDEVFGPVLAVIRAADFDDALRIANATDYKLTGGLFSRTPSHIDRARRDLRVGNLYINRGITGALVARQPFGGFGLSGTGSKAGGPDYLRQFVHERTLTENTMRRGFSPQITG